MSWDYLLFCSNNNKNVTICHFVKILEPFLKAQKVVLNSFDSKQSVFGQMK